MEVINRKENKEVGNRDQQFKTSVCLRGGGVSPFANGQKVTVHKDQKLLPFVLMCIKCKENKRINNNKDIHSYDMGLIVSLCINVHKMQEK